MRKVVAAALVVTSGALFLGCGSQRPSESRVQHIGPLLPSEKTLSLNDEGARSMGLFKPLGNVQYCQTGDTEFHIKPIAFHKRTTFHELYGVMCFNPKTKTAILKNSQNVCLGKAVPSFPTVSNRLAGIVSVGECGGQVAYSLRRENPLNVNNLLVDPYIIKDAQGQPVGRFVKYNGTARPFDFVIEGRASELVARVGGIPFWRIPVRGGWEMHDRQGLVEDGKEHSNPTVFKDRKWIYLLAAAQAMMQ